MVLKQSTFCSLGPTRHARWDRTGRMAAVAPRPQYHLPLPCHNVPSRNSRAHILGYRRSRSKFQKIEIIFSNHNGVKPDINYSKTGKNHKYMDLNGNQKLS